MVDYAYDSGEEWEEENPNDADDVNDDGEEDEGSESADSDLDNWLVDDDEEEVISVHAADDLLMDLDTLPTLNKSPPKRKAEELSKKKLAKKRKVVVPLVPYSKGPCWETVIGQCEAEVLKQHRIQLFNDTPCEVDPFTFVSKCTEDYSSATKQPTPPTIVNTSSSPSNLMPPPPPPPTTTKRIVKPKTTFPDALIPELLSKITSMQAPTIPFLVDSIYQDLRSQNVKKNSIEAKVREVSEKCKEKKYWVVKADVLAKHASPCLIPSA
ncbi:hypothetical protein ONZ45_g17867 [Pleurotus djamor]|nr:hypothetical protein ONZ45_g17867 [Pleurotus djamor]